MKSLNFEKRNLRTVDLLSREQLKNVMGGIEKSEPVTTTPSRVSERTDFRTSAAHNVSRTALQEA